MGVQYSNLLATEPSQTVKTWESRASKAMNPFYIKEDVDLTDKEILLVDDIYTTGLTIHHAGCKLYDKNVRKFKVLNYTIKCQKIQSAYVFKIG